MCLLGLSCPSGIVGSRAKQNSAGCSVLLLIHTADLGKFAETNPEAWCDLLLS